MQRVSSLGHPRPSVCLSAGQTRSKWDTESEVVSQTQAVLSTVGAGLFLSGVSWDTLTAAW